MAGRMKSSEQSVMASAVQDPRFLQAKLIVAAVWNDMSMINPNIVPIAAQTKIRWQDELQYAEQLLAALQRELEQAAIDDVPVLSPP